MYPKVSDFLNDVFGTNLCLPIQSFGFFVAIAFLAAYYVTQQELKRKQLQGFFTTQKVQVLSHAPVKPLDILINFVVLAAIGYKLGLAFEDYDIFCDNPQEAILSSNGSVLGAFLLGAIGAAYKFYEFKKFENVEPQSVTENHGLAEDSGTLFTIAFVAGILGAKLFHNLEFWDKFIKDPVGSMLSFDGLTFYGGLLCAAAAMIYYLHKKKHNLLAAADAITPTVILAYGIGRLGCHFAGDGDWGIENLKPKPFSWLPDWAWAYKYPHNVLSEGVKIQGCVGEYCNELPNPVYPTAVYEAIMGIAIFIFLWLIRLRLPFMGQLTGIYLILNGLERFLIEIVRVNDRYAFQMSQAQFIATALMVFGAVLLYLSTFVWKKDNFAIIYK
ncbi:MAG: prolipoprotein diacylglyceryl transferase [Bacteroidia bacterium]